VIVLYDGECGFCKVVLAALLSWDRAGRLEPVRIQSTLGDELLSDVDPRDRLGSWHLIDDAGMLHSAGAAVPAFFAGLPGGGLIARASARFPRTTSRLYEWVARHRALLGRPFKRRRRDWAERVLSERAAHDIGDPRG
jgi:predicted DCC family thiol-disulfide oxidoreductase YuxK